ncbi:plastidic ATP/ADP-transporter-like [Vigna radiata var. radiata]|uniref:Plastidic ATP/ADP-transporter-like n=1 Tax=Vigna radiata var. radiata TaxID=3916 RepID=A0A1S3W0Y2_VIGRR|nr:plastidic ATP/ADP-transporter-like [Vigna radiata var. radiata]
MLLVIILAWLSVAKSLDSQFSALRREEELEKEMERVAVVKIQVVAKDEDGNGSLASVPLLNQTAGGDSSRDVAFRILESINKVKLRGLQGVFQDTLEVETRIYVCDIKPQMLNVGRQHALEKGK